jgi:UNC-6/NTR/C345C module
LGQVYNEHSEYLQETSGQPRSTWTDVLLGSDGRLDVQMSQNKNQQVRRMALGVCSVKHLIGVDRSYLILGAMDESHHGRPGFDLNTRSIVIEWKAEWTSRMRRFERRASRKCK